MITKKDWNDKLSICIEPNSFYMQDIFIGIRKSMWNGKFTDDLEKKFFDNMSLEYGKTFQSSAQWIIYRNTTPSSFSKGTYYPGLENFTDGKIEEMSLILHELNIYKKHSQEIGELCKKALY